MNTSKVIIVVLVSSILINSLLEVALIVLNTTVSNDHLNLILRMGTPCYRLFAPLIDLLELPSPPYFYCGISH